ncbi:MAG: hypothetical protein L0211_22685, partial [Planctomycetaceae bacterium]|nr:hypothetical protein [Planctomycetaceae bacterium]
MAFSMQLTNALGLSPHDLTKLENILEKLRKDDAELHDRLVIYLVDGGDDAVLKELPKVAGGPEKLCLGCASQYGGSQYGPISWFTFLRDLEIKDTQFYLRLARAFAAVAKHLPADRFFCQQHLGGDRGVEILLQEATKTSIGMSSSDPRACKLPAETVLAMLAAEGCSAESLVKAPFIGNASNWQDMKVRQMILSLADMGKVFVNHRELVAPLVAAGHAEKRVMAVENLALTGANPSAFASELVAAATDSSKLLREAAQGLLKGIATDVRPELERLAGSGNRTQREHAVRLLGRLYGGEARDFLTGLKEKEKSAPIREAVDAILAEGRSAAVPVAQVFTPPPRDPIDLHPPVTPGLRKALELHCARGQSEHALRPIDSRLKGYL